MGKLKEKDFEKLNTFYVCADCSEPCIWTYSEWCEADEAGGGDMGCANVVQIKSGKSREALYEEVQKYALEDI